MPNIIEGVCRCGNISYQITTEIPLQQITARSCDCSFCRSYQARTWTDPSGTASIRVTDSQNLNKQRFALQTADLYICRICGDYVGAVLTENGKIWSTLNLNLTGLDIASKPASYGNENSVDRISRRKKSWTPTVISGLT